MGRHPGAGLASPADLLQHCSANGFVLRSFDLQRPSLHDVFLHLVGGA